MKGYVNQFQIEYIVFHLKQSIVLNDDILSQFQFLREGDAEHDSKSIFFNLSSSEFNVSNVQVIQDIPILFSTKVCSEFYTIEEDKLYFHHDLIKSSFYLLSAYQEYQNQDFDSFGRYKFENSVQKKLGFAKKPVVNYYFKIIEEALIEFNKHQGIPVRSKKLFSSPVFFLTHDIDNVDYYTKDRFLYKIKEILGMVVSQYGLQTNIKHLIKTGLELLKFKAKNNPNWNFEYLIEQEQKNEICSAFYFLPKDKKHQDSTYSFNEKRIKELFQYILNSKCEVGIHGTVNSVENLEVLKMIIADLKNNASIEKLGIRQHRLLYKLPLTSINQAKAGVTYDTTLSFAEHEGFRNSYCLPFKLYDFDHDKAIDVWQIPLNAMDVTLFHYRKLNNKKALQSILEIIQEVEKFNGVFTLLWHNDFFDEDRYPGVKRFYESLLSIIGKSNAQSLTGLEIIAHVE